LKSSTQLLPLFKRVYQEMGQQIGRKAIKNKQRIVHGLPLLKRIQQIQKHLVLSG
jgi:hypothetical protein